MPTIPTVERDPRFVDVVLKRCQAVSGLSAILESTGETFEAAARRRRGSLVLSMHRPSN
ncbi:MAG: hypothetical protein ABJA83_15550 [Burkholderiaceae bacterium]